MQNFKSIVLLSFIFACGNAESEPREIINTSDNLPEQYKPVRVARIITNENVTVDFTQLWVEGDNGPESSITISSFGPKTGPNPVSEVLNSLDVTLTTAEIYLALRGEIGWEILPAELAEAHFNEVSYMNRTHEFLHAFRKPLTDQVSVIPVLEKSVQHGDQMTIGFDTEFIPTIPGRHWTNTQTTRQIFVCQRHDAGFHCLDSEPQPSTYFACSARADWVDMGFYNQPTAADCKPTRRKGWIRNGINMEAGNAPANDFVTSQWFYGPSVNGDWATFPAVQMFNNFYYVQDWNASAKHGMTLTATHGTSGLIVIEHFTGVSTPN